MDSSLVTFLANAGIAGIIIVLIIAGYLVPKPTHKRVLRESARKDALIEKLQEALTLERQRSDAATQAGAVTNQLITSLVKLAGGRREDQRPEAAPAVIPAVKAALELTGEDLGL